jgi:hypothetical protein
LAYNHADSLILHLWALHLANLNMESQSSWTLGVLSFWSPINAVCTCVCVCTYVMRICSLLSSSLSGFPALFPDGISG